jgi:AcrR family transcriptional regulator
MTSATLPGGREQLRSAAFELFSQHDVDAVSVRAIAARAGVTAGLVKYHFGSKDGLLAEVDAHAIAVCGEALATAMKQLDDPVGGVSPVEGVAAEIQRALREDAVLRGYIARRLASDDEPGRVLFRQFVGLVNTGLARLRAAGYVRPDVGEAGALVLLTDLILAPLVLARQWTAFTGMDSFDVSLTAPAVFVTNQVLSSGLFVEPS